MQKLINALEAKMIEVLQAVSRPPMLSGGTWAVYRDGPQLNTHDYGVRLGSTIEISAEAGLTREQFDEIYAYAERCQRALDDYGDVIAVHARHLERIPEDVLTPELNRAFDQSTMCCAVEADAENPIAGLL